MGTGARCRDRAVHAVCLRLSSIGGMPSTVRNHGQSRLRLFPRGNGLVLMQPVGTVSLSLILVSVHPGQPPCAGSGHVAGHRAHERKAGPAPGLCL